MRETGLLLVTTSLLLMFLTGGCYTDMNRQLYESVQAGQTAQEVEKVLGEPEGWSASRWVYVEPFYLAHISFREGQVAKAARYSEHEVDYFAREYHD